ncbi:MAG: TonB-dependent receptor [Pseudomonadota bacterium]|nr:TonB-dependent receptor [Pseudomonadota bacterium]
MVSRKKLSIAILSALAVSPITFAAELEQVSVQADKELVQQQTANTETLLNTSNSETGTALRQINGVEASRMGGHGVDLVIRGQKESQLNILIDGAKIEGGCPNRMDPPTAYAELSSIDEITVIKGVQSVTHGTGGTGGTVLFERIAPTFEEGKPYNGEVNLGTTSNGVKQDINATLSAGGDKGYIVVQAAKKSADNYEDGNGNEVRSSYDSQQGHVDLGWTPNDNHELRLSYENTLVEDALFQGASMDSPESDGTTVRLRYKGEKINDVIQSIDADVYSSEVDHLMDNYSFRPATPAEKQVKNATNVTTDGAKIKLTSMVGHTQLDYGVQYEAIGKESTLQKPSGTPTIWYMWPDVQTDTKSVFAESTSFFKDNQKVIMGLRYDNHNTDANDADVATDAGKTAISQYNRYTDFSGETSNEHSNLNGLVRYEKKLDNGINLYTGLSLTHRYADATELYIAKGGTMVKDGIVSDVSWIGNPDLKPEQHNQFDIGFAKNGKDNSWSISAYYDAVNDYILRDLNPSANQTGEIGGLLPDATVDKRTVYLNKDATIMGIDASSSYAINTNLTLGVNASLTKGFNDTDDRNLSNIAPLSGALYAEYQTANWNSGARFNFATDQTEVNDAGGELETAGYTTVDLYGQYAFNKTFALSAGVDNVFDKAYENYLNRTDITSGNTYKLYEPGRTLWAKLNAKF